MRHAGLRYLKMTSINSLWQNRALNLVSGNLGQCTGWDSDSSLCSLCDNVDLKPAGCERPQYWPTSPLSNSVSWVG